MISNRTLLALLAASAPLALAACGQPAERTDEEHTATERSVMLDPQICASRPDGFSLESSNRYFPIEVGRSWLLEGESDGELVAVLIRVLDRTELVARVWTRVIEEREWVDGALAEVSRNYVVEAYDGTVCYFGEDVDVYEDGRVVSHEGSWRADVGTSMPGILMPADPRVGTGFYMERSRGVAEDQGFVVESEPASVPAGNFSETVTIEEYDPFDDSVDIKVYGDGVGLLIDEELELLRFD